MDQDVSAAFSAHILFKKSAALVTSQKYSYKYEILISINQATNKYNVLVLRSYN